MARIRSIKPEFWRSPSTASASPWARLLYIAMWNWADDFGVGEWTPRELLGFAFPNDAQITDAEFQCLCTEVATCFGTQFYVVRGRRYYCIPAWDEHQKNERRAKGKYPTPADPESAPDRVIISGAEKRGITVRTHGKDPAGTGEQGKRGTGEQIYSSPAVIERLFDEIWSSWPKKVERKAALGKFNIAARRFGDAPALAARVTEFGRAYAATTEKRFVPALGVWLAHERWTDELPQQQSPARRSIAKADQNAAAYYEIYGGDGGGGARSVPALDVGLSS